MCVCVHARMCIQSLSYARGADGQLWGQHAGPPQNGALAGFEVLSGPLLCTKNQLYSIILTLSSGAHMFSPFGCVSS